MEKIGLDHLDSRTVTKDREEAKVFVIVKTTCFVEKVLVALSVVQDLESLFAAIMKKSVDNVRCADRFEFRYLHFIRIFFNIDEVGIAFDVEFRSWTSVEWLTDDG